MTSKNIDYTLCAIGVVDEQDNPSYERRTMEYLQPFLLLEVFEFNELALVDTGSSISCVSEDFYNIIAKNKFVEMPVTGVKIMTATGGTSKAVKRQIFFSFYISENEFQHDFLVIKNLNVKIILWMDWITDRKSVV